MTPSARLALAVDFVDEILESNRAGDRILRDGLRARRYAGSKDRKAVIDLVYGMLRSWYAAEFRMVSDGVEATVRNRAITYFGHILRTPLDDAGRWFDGSKYGFEPLTDEEIRYWRACSLDRPIPDWARWEVPPWVAPKLIGKFGDQAEAEALALAQTANVDLRVNTEKINRQTVLETLRDEGVACEITPYAPHGIRLINAVSLTDHTLVTKGKIEFQDEGSQLIALTAAHFKGDLWIDYCAGAGGKTLALAAEATAASRLIALDVDEKRLMRLRRRLAKATERAVECLVIPPQGLPPEHLRDSADIVLADVPCSGSGTWRRAPDARIKLRSQAVTDYLKRQASILDSAATLVRRGGKLIYATCSILQEENEFQIEAFLERQNGFSLLPADEILAEATGHHIPLDGPMIQLTPHRMGTDGFFVSILEKQ